MLATRLILFLLPFFATMVSAATLDTILGQMEKDPLSEKPFKVTFEISRNSYPKIWADYRGRKTTEEGGPVGDLVSERRTGEIIVFDDVVRIRSELIALTGDGPAPVAYKESATLHTEGSEITLNLYDAEKEKGVGNATFRPTNPMRTGKPSPLVKADYIKLLRSTKNLELTAASKGMEGVECTVLTGLSGQNKIHFYLDPKRDFLPVAEETYQPSGDLLSSIIYTYKKEESGAWHLQQGDSKNFHKGKIFFEERWTFQKHELLTERPGDLATLSIPEGVTVSDRRFNKHFTYPMGHRPPTEGELAEMAADPAAIQRYQAADHLLPASQPVL